MWSRMRAPRPWCSPSASQVWHSRIRWLVEMHQLAPLQNFHLPPTRLRAALYLVNREGVRRALELAKLALERDPNYGSVLAVATRCHSNIYASGWTNDLEATRKEGIELARRALRVAGDDPFIIANLQFRSLYSGRTLQRP